MKKKTELDKTFETNKLRLKEEFNKLLSGKDKLLGEIQELKKHPKITNKMFKELNRLEKEIL